MEEKWLKQGQKRLQHSYIVDYKVLSVTKSDFNQLSDMSLLHLWGSIHTSAFTQSFITHKKPSKLQAVIQLNTTSD